MSMRVLAVVAKAALLARYVLLAHLGLVVFWVADRDLFALILLSNWALILLALLYLLYLFTQL